MPEPEARKLKRYLKSLTAMVGHHLRAMDKVMQETESHQRGRKVAQLCNMLEMENDKARYFGLGIDFRKDRKK